MKTVLIENIICKIGKNAKENWNILDSSKKDFFFFHLSAFPSGFVIMETKELPSLEVIKKVSELCRDNTKYKNLKDLKVDYTVCGNVEKGDVVGEIIYKSNRKVKQIKI